ncbi:CBU_0592 family membrane protein [Arthrobacter sp. Z4-13]
MALWAELSGWFGALIVLVGYGAFSLGWLGNGRLFQLCNVAGSAALLVNGAYHGAWPSVALNVAWGAIAAVAFARFQRARRNRTTITGGAPEVSLEALVSTGQDTRVKKKL